MKNLKQENAISFHDDIATGWNEKYSNMAFKSRLRIFESSLNKIKIEGQCWLDAGCGSGPLSRFLAEKGAQVNGIDGSMEMIAQAHRLSGQNPIFSTRISYVHVKNLETTTLSPLVYDGILCSSVLEYLTSPIECLSGFVNAIKPNGYLIISVPNKYSIFRIFLRFTRSIFKLFCLRYIRYLDFSINQYSRTEFENLLKDFGMIPINVNFFGGPLPRWMQKYNYIGPLMLILAKKK